MSSKPVAGRRLVWVGRVLLAFAVGATDIGVGSGLAAAQTSGPVGSETGAPGVRARAEDLAREASKTFDSYFDAGRSGRSEPVQRGAEPVHAPGESSSDWLARTDRDFKSLIERLAKPTAPNPVADAAEQQRKARSAVGGDGEAGRTADRQGVASGAGQPQVLPPIGASGVTVSDATGSPSADALKTARDEVMGKLAQAGSGQEAVSPQSSNPAAGAVPASGTAAETEGVISWLNRTFRRFQDEVIGGLARSPDTATAPVAAKPEPPAVVPKALPERPSQPATARVDGGSEAKGPETSDADVKQAEAARRAEITRKAEAERTQAQEQKAAQESKQADAKRKVEAAEKAEAERLLTEERKSREVKAGEEAKQAEAKRKAEVAQKAELERKAADERKAQERKTAEERKARELKAGEEAKQAEAKRKAEVAQKADLERKAADERKALERKTAEEVKLAEDRRQAALAQKAAEEQKAAADARKAQAERAEASRLADVRRAAGAKANDDARRASEAAERAQAEAARLAKVLADAEVRQSASKSGGRGDAAGGKSAPPAGEISGLGLKGARSAEEGRAIAEADRSVEAIRKAADRARAIEQAVRAEADVAQRAAKSVDDARIKAEQATLADERKRADANVRLESQKAAEAARRAILAAAQRSKLAVVPPVGKPVPSAPATIVARPTLGSAQSPTPVTRPGDAGKRGDAGCRKAGRRITPPGWYVVGRGDSLWKISEAHYGDGKRFRRIMRANRDGIGEANSIEPCQRVFLPK